MLSKRKSIKIPIYGTLEKPVHAQNLKETVNKIKEKHNNSFIIAIDASVGEEKNIGNIKITSGSLTPGACLDKDLPPIGDISISGVSARKSYFNQMETLCNTRLWYSYNMAVKAEKALYKVLNEQCKNKNLVLRRVSNG